MGTTIKDIARLSGVGIATVSRVLNGSGSASKETKEKVYAAVRELNYIPNSSARNLKKGQSRTIALLAKSIINPFFQKMIPTIERQIALQGYVLEIRNISHSEQEMEVAIRETQSKNLCGIIIMGGNFGYTNEDFKRLEIPCVLVTIKAADDVDERLYSSIIIDDEAESKKATKYLIELGHKRIGCIYNNYGPSLTPNYKRFLGYQKALLEHGIPFDEGLISTINSTESGYDFGFRMMKLLIARNPDMTAVVTAADVMAVGAAKAILSSGFRLPEDISVIGFDGIEEAEYYNPSLDTIEQPAQQMAQLTVSALMDMLRGGSTIHRVLESNLLKRGSCARVIE